MKHLILLQVSSTVPSWAIVLLVCQIIFLIWLTCRVYAKRSLAFKEHSLKANIMEYSRLVLLEEEPTFFFLGLEKERVSRMHSCVRAAAEAVIEPLLSIKLPFSSEKEWEEQAVFSKELSKDFPSREIFSVYLVAAWTSFSSSPRRYNHLVCRIQNIQKGDESDMRWLRQMNYFLDFLLDSMCSRQPYDLRKLSERARKMYNTLVYDAYMRKVEGGLACDKNSVAVLHSEMLEVSDSLYLFVTDLLKQCEKIQEGQDLLPWFERREVIPAS